MSLLDWAVDLAERFGSAKCEFCLLARLVDPDHEAVTGLEFDFPIDAAMAHRWLPTRFPAVGMVDGEDLLGELSYANGGTPVFVNDTNEPAIYLPHRLMWATDFGTTPIDHPQAKARIEAALAAETNVDWVGQYLIALHCLGVLLLPADRLAELSAWRNANPPTWENYHAHLVIELLFALTGVEL